MVKKCLPPNFDGIPQYLKEIPQWCVWKYKESKERSKPAKVPHQVMCNRMAKPNDPDTWGSYEDAKYRFLNGGFDGVGFFLSEHDGLTGIDLDGCLDEKGKITKPEAERIVSMFPDSYWEISPSGRGLRCFVVGKPSRSGKGPKANSWIEVYSHPSSRYLTITGKSFRDGTIVNGQNGLERLHSEFMEKGGDRAPSKPKSHTPVGSDFLDDDQLISKALRAANGDKFASLWAGEYGSNHSSADQALCNILAFWTGRDADRIDRLFRQSGLYREKWDHVHHSDGRTYGQGTIDKAVSGVDDDYSTPRPPNSSPTSSPTGGGRKPRARKEINDQSPAHHAPATDGEDLGLNQGLHRPPPSYIREISKGIFEDGDGLIVGSKAAKILAEFMSNRYAFEPSSVLWYEFRGTHWETVTESEINHMVYQALSIGCGDTGFEKRYFIDSIDLLKKSGEIPLPKISSGMISFQNGMFDPATGELHKVSPGFSDTWALPHSYSRSDGCPFFQKWLSYVTGDDHGLALMIQAFTAATLTGRADLQRFMFMEGPGGTGKSTFQRLIQAMIGPDNFEITDLRNLERSQFETSRFYGKRLIIITDSDRYGGSVNVLKALTGQDPIRNERKNVQAGKGFIYGGMVLMAGNETLQTTDYTSGLSRRQIVIRFDRAISNEERDRFIGSGGEEAMRREIPEIINWALKLDRDRVTDIFKNLPASVTQSTFDASTNQNPLIGWVTTNIVPNKDRVTRVGMRVESVRNGRKIYLDADKKLYPNYLAWCQNTTRQPVTHNRFSELLLDVLQNILKVTATKGRDKHGVWVKGIELNPMRASTHWHDLNEAVGTGDIRPDEYDGA